jgi:hypothetical protein
MSTTTTAFNDLVLAHTLSQMEPAAVLQSCTRVCRQWHRVALRCRPVALHVLERHAALAGDFSNASLDPGLNAPRVRQWCSVGRTRFVAAALLRVEWDDLADRPWSIDASGRDSTSVCIANVMSLLGYMCLAAATVRDADLLARLVDDGAFKAIAFFLRPRYFNPRGVDRPDVANNDAVRSSAWCLANIAALPDGRALLARTDAHDLLLDMLALATDTSMYMIAELCALALANLYCDARVRAHALARLPRVADVIKLTIDGPFESRDVRYHACRAVRELVGKVDAAAINASLDAVVASQLLNLLVESALVRKWDRASGMVLATLSEIGRAAVRPPLLAALLQPHFVQLLAHLGHYYALSDMERVYPASVCLAQLAVSREFVAALAPEQIDAVARLGTFLLDHWSRASIHLPQYDIAVRLTVAVLHILSQVPEERRSALTVPPLARAALPGQLQLRQMLLIGANLLVGNVTAKQGKRALKRFAEAVSTNRRAVGLPPLSVSQFVQQRPTWVASTDLFGFGNALVFEANAFDSLENVARATEWIGQRLAVQSNDLEVPFTVQIVFKAAGLVAMRSQRRFADGDALRQFLVDELCPLAEREGALAYPFAMSEVLNVVVARVLAKTPKR